MRKLALTIVGPFVLVIAATVGFIWWERGAPPGFRPESIDVDVSTINRDHRGVRIRGTGHLQARVRQESGEDTWYLYPLLPPGDTLGREVRVLLRTQTKPDDLYGFEERTVEGFARPPGNLIDRVVLSTLEKNDYILMDDFVVVEEWPND